MLSRDPKVKKLIKLSTKKLKGKKMSEFERNEADNLLKDPKVKAYLEASKKVGERIGWIYGGLSGAALGGLISAGMFASMGAGGIGLAALTLLGAISSGITTGYPAAKIKGILRKWKTEEELTKGGLQGGAIVKM